MALRPVGANAGDDGERDVLGTDAHREHALDPHPHALRPPLPQGLGHEHMGDFGGADPECDGPEGPMGRGVGVAAHDGQPRQGQPLLRPHHMDDALAGIVEAEEVDAVGEGVLVELLHHPADALVRNAARAAGGHVMVGHPEGEVRPRHRRVATSKLGEGVVRPLVHEVPVDPEQGLPVLAGENRVLVPNLVEEGAGLAHGGHLGLGRSCIKRGP
jgi:hypothetical protein